MGSLSDSRIGIIGAGSIGQTLVSYLSPFEVDITTFSRSGGNGSLTMDQLDPLLPTLDLIFLILPLNEESQYLINARRLALMKNGAILINVARGKVVDTDALVAELSTGRICAALDVVIQLTRMPDGRRCVSEVVEVVGVRDDVYVTNTLFRLDRRTGFGFMREAVNPAGDKLRREPMLAH